VTGRSRRPHRRRLFVARLEHDPEKWVWFSEKIMLNQKTWSAMVIQPNPIAV
jgi:hypothetical protein